MTLREPYRDTCRRGWGDRSRSPMVHPRTQHAAQGISDHDLRRTLRRLYRIGWSDRACGLPLDSRKADALLPGSAERQRSERTCDESCTDHSDPDLG